MRLADRRRALIVAVKKGRLPSGYQEVEWIQGTGTQYINTGVNPTQDYRFILYVSEFPDSSSMNIAFANTTNFGVQCKPYDNTNRFEFFYNRVAYKSNDAAIPNSTDTFVLELGKDMKVNGLLITSISGNFNITQPLLTTYRASSIYGAKCKFHKIEVYYNATLYKKLIPCYRKSDSVAGMYDLVNDAFYTNAGTGSFVVGGEVN